MEVNVNKPIFYGIKWKEIEDSDNNPPLPTTMLISLTKFIQLISSHDIGIHLLLSVRDCRACVFWGPIRNNVFGGIMEFMKILITPMTCDHTNSTQKYKHGHIYTYGGSLSLILHWSILKKKNSSQWICYYNRDVGIRYTCEWVISFFIYSYKWICGPQGMIK